MASGTFTLYQFFSPGGILSRTHPAYEFRRGQLQMAQAVEQAPAPGAEIILTRIVRAVGQPQADDRRPHRTRDLDAVKDVIDRAPADRGRRVTEAAEHVLVVLEQIWIDGSDLDPMTSRYIQQRRPVIHPVPGDVNRDAGANPGQTVHDRRVCELLFDCARGSRLGEHFEPGP